MDLPGDQRLLQGEATPLLNTGLILNYSGHAHLPSRLLACLHFNVQRSRLLLRLKSRERLPGASLVGFLKECVAKGSLVRTDDWNGYNGVEAAGFAHRVIPIRGDRERAQRFFPHVHLVASLLKRWLGATHQGRVQKPHLQAYLDEYAFRFNRRRSMHVGKSFHRLVEQMVLHKAKTYREIVDGSESN